MTSCACLCSLIQFKVLHSTHFSKAKLAEIYPGVDDRCNRCGFAPADHSHVFSLSKTEQFLVFCFQNTIWLPAAKSSAMSFDRHFWGPPGAFCLLKAASRCYCIVISLSSENNYFWVEVSQASCHLPGWGMLCSLSNMKKFNILWEGLSNNFPLGLLKYLWFWLRKFDCMLTLKICMNVCTCDVFTWHFLY